MLSFYFDLIDRFIDRKDFNLLEMDTDSLYMALSGPTLDDIVKPELKNEWVVEKKRWFPRPENLETDLREPGKRKTNLIRKFVIAFTP
jgi:hypothetical protein